MKPSTNIGPVITLVITLLSFLLLIIAKVNGIVYIALAGFLATLGLLLLELRKQQKKHKILSLGITELLERVAGGQDSPELGEDRALLERLSGLLASLDETRLQLERQKEAAEGFRRKNELVEQALIGLCCVRLPLDIGPQWDAMIEKDWSLISSETLESLNKMKIMNEQNQEFVQQVVKEFGVQQDNFAEFSETYSKGITDYAKKVGFIKSSFFEDIEASSSRIEETFAKFGEVTEITERIKMISLNMSIEASKVRGSEAFYLLARELRKLAVDTEETLRGITMIIQATIESMRASKEKQIREFMVMDTTIQQFINTLENYKLTSAKLAEFIQKAINQIDGNQSSQRSILLDFFKNLQRIAIIKEEFEHRIQFDSIMLAKTNEVIEQLVRKDRVCGNDACSGRRWLLEELAAIANTDEERKFVNELFKTLLNEDREEEHGTIEDKDFIQF